LCSCQSKIIDSKQVPEQLLSEKQLKEDFKVLRTTLEEIHPGLYFFMQRDSLNYYFAEAESKLNKEMTKDEFLRIINPVIVKLYDEHTNINVTYKYDSIQKLMPIKVRWVNGKPYIFKNLLNNPKVIIGSEIISLNGKEINELYYEQKLYYPSAGYTDPTLEYDVFSLHFDYMYASFFEQPDSFKIEAIHPISKRKYTCTIPSVLKSDSLHFLPIIKMANEYCNKDTAYKFKIKDDIAFMTITGFNTFEMEATGIDYDKRLHEDFKTIKQKKIKNLILDLRYCFGGQAGYTAELTSYLYGKPFQLFDTLYSTINKIPTYYKYTDWEIGDWEKEITSLKKIHRDSKIKNDWTIERDTFFSPKSNQFTGNLYVLINSDCHSAASITATLLKHYTNAVFIGVPISGQYNGGCAMETITLTLPNTKLEVYVPLLRYMHSLPSNSWPYKENLIPDYLITPSIQDLINQDDIVMERAVKLIRNSR
jgi:hypothetical protein